MRGAIALQEPAILLQHLFYFIAHKTTPLSYKCFMVFLQILLSN